MAVGVTYEGVASALRDRAGVANCVTCAGVGRCVSGRVADTGLFRRRMETGVSAAKGCRNDVGRPAKASFALACAVGGLKGLRELLSISY